MTEDASPQLRTPLVYPSLDLLGEDIFSQDHYFLSETEQHALSFQRARAIAQKYALTIEDVLYLKPKFWLMQRDMIMAKDAAVCSILTGQFNLAGGTLAKFVRDRPELIPLMKDILEFKIAGQYLLTEVGHGLDASNLETTAVLLASGEFEIHSPTKDAGKWMPITTPQGGFKRVGIVFARLIVEEEDRGVRPFIVHLNDGRNMCPGITAKWIPTRAGSKPAGHALTTFDHVRIPGTAILGSLDKPTDMKASFFSAIFRVGVGVLHLALSNIAGLKTATYITGTYSSRRMIGAPDGTRQQIIQFRTQHGPIIHALAEIAVMEAYADEAIKSYLTERRYNVQHALATCFKAVVGYATQRRMFQLTERCGAQGLFKHNQIIEMQLEARAANIAEGDVLVLCIRLATELLIGRYEMPKPQDPTCPLAQREAGLFKEARMLLEQAGGNHRSDAFSRLVLPLCQPLVEAIGHRMAYEAAVKANVHSDLVGLYEAGVMMPDRGSWLTENEGTRRLEILLKEDRHITNLLPHMERLLDETGAAPYATAPILSQEKWDKFVDQMKTYREVSSVSQDEGGIPSSRA